MEETENRGFQKERGRRECELRKWKIAREIGKKRERENRKRKSEMEES